VVAILRAHSRLIHEFEIGLMDEGRRLELLVETPAPKLPAGNAAELRVDKLDEPVERTGRPLAVRQ
jgi:hypothetical protein